MIRALLLALPLLLSVPVALPASAQVAVPLAPAPAPSAGLDEADPALYGMLQAMGIYDILSIIGHENIRGADALEDSMFPGQGGPAWTELVTRLNEAERMAQLFETAFPGSTLTPEQVAEVTRFMTSQAGQRLVRSEVDTRVLFLDEEAVDIANESFMNALDNRDGRLEILYDLNDANDYIERNVSGALNLRFAFYSGLADGGAFGSDMGEDVMVQQVWSQEPDVRQMTIEWLFSYQLTAYAGISDDDLRAYVEFGRSDAGRAVNAALFAAFDAMLATLSYEMGHGAAGFIAGEDT